MKLRREVPEWMSCHPDHSAICARPSGSGGPVARFTQKIIPPGWVQQKCVDCCVPPEPVPGSADQSLAIIVTVQDELASLVNALKSWQRHGLLDYAQERYLNIDGGDSDSRNRITGLARSYGFTVFTSETSQGISSAMARLMQAVKSPFVLLLEKDWKLVESRATVLKQLDLAKRLMFSRQNGSRADLVKFRSRWNFGFPNVSPRKTVPPDWDIGVSMVRTRARWEPHLFCNIYHYQSDEVLLSRYPNRMWRCGCDFNYWCFDSGQCGWTNNPIMFRRKWWLDMMHGIAHKHRNKVFEAGTYYSDEWLLPHWVVAESDGLFTHDEIGEGHERKYI